MFFGTLGLPGLHSFLPRGADLKHKHDSLLHDSSTQYTTTLHLLAPSHYHQVHPPNHQPLTTFSKPPETPEPQPPKSTMTTTNPPTLLNLPLEIRLQILTHVLYQPPRTGFHLQTTSQTSISTQRPSALYYSTSYLSSTNLTPLLVCRQLHFEISLLGFSFTHFIIPSTVANPSTCLSVLSNRQVSVLRKISLIIAGPRQLRSLVHWTQFPFNNQHLKLSSLGLIFHRSPHAHYPADFTTDLVHLLRRIDNVERIWFLRNGANVKGGFRTWCNRLVGQMLSVDHWERYDTPENPAVERWWWEWGFDDLEQRFELRAVESKEVVTEEVYMQRVRPWVEEWAREVEKEEGDPDQTSRT